jgi:hypothetical protein
MRADFLSRSERRELLSRDRGHRKDYGIARRANTILLLDDDTIRV